MTAFQAVDKGSIPLRRTHHKSPDALRPGFYGTTQVKINCSTPLHIVYFPKKCYYGYVMTTQEIATNLVALCREGKYEQVHDTLYDTDIISIEMDESMGPREARGINAIKEKGSSWAQMFAGPVTTWCDDAIVSGNSFACRMGFSGPGHDGNTIAGEEIAVYVTKDGKIIEERFYW